MRQVLELVDREQLGDKARAALGLAAPSQDMRDIATAFASLQQQRHWADYDPRGKVSRSDVRDLIEDLEQALG